jgi:hypothetical protein
MITKQLDLELFQCLQVWTFIDMMYRKDSLLEWYILNYVSNPGKSTTNFIISKIFRDWTNLLDNSSDFYACLFDIWFPEDDLRGSKHVKSIGGLCVKVYIFIRSMHMLVLSIKLYINSRMWKEQCTAIVRCRSSIYVSPYTVSYGFKSSRQNPVFKQTSSTLFPLSWGSFCGRYCFLLSPCTYILFRK